MVTTDFENKKLHATNEKEQHAPKWHQILCFQVFPGCHNIPISFSMCSCSALPIAPHLIPFAFGKCCPFTYIGGPKEGSPYTKIEPSIFGSLHSVSFYFVIGSLQKEKLKLSESPH
jgi:hypothetical protein